MTTRWPMDRVRWLLVGVAVCAYAGDRSGSGPPDATATAGTTRLVLLGTGTPNADPDRSGPAVAVVSGGVPYLVDCGPGVVRRVAAAERNGIAGLRVANITRLFITHLHTDHTVGYPDVVFTPWVLGRREPLVVYGPSGIRSMTDHILQAYEEDIRVRIDGLEPANAVGYKVDVHEIEAGLIYRDDNVAVTAIPVNHGLWHRAFGFRFAAADRTIVISGDTRPSPELIKQSAGCDILLHEVYSQAGFLRRSPPWQRYHSRFHTSSHELAMIANQVKPKLLVLYHQLMWGRRPDEILAEIRSIYRGPVSFGNDLDVF